MLLLWKITCMDDLLWYIGVLSKDINHRLKLKLISIIFNTRQIKKSIPTPIGIGKTMSSLLNNILSITQITE